MKSLFAFSTVVLFLNLLSAQESQNFTHKIQSEAFGTERTIYVYLPERYLDNEQDTFMVTYVLDAQAQYYWNMAKGNIGYLVDNYQVVPMIAVGIHTENRGPEFVPQPHSDDPDLNRSGTAHLLLRHLEEEVIPLIAEKYRVNTVRAIVGHSRGGAFVTHTLFSEHSDMFRGYINISPALGHLNDQILKDAEKVLSSGQKIMKFLYASHGNVGSIERNFTRHVAYLDSLIQKYPNPTLAWEKMNYEGMDHWGIVIASWNDALLKMNRTFTLDQKTLEDFAANTGVSMKSQIDNFFREKNEHFGYSVVPPLILIRYYADQLENIGYPEQALEIYQWALEYDPANIRVYRGMAWIYRQKKDFVKAKEMYQQALKYLEEQKGDMEEDQYSENREELMENIEKMERGEE